MEAGLSGQTHLAVCVLGAGATGSFVEKPVGWGQEACDHPEAQPAEERGCGPGTGKDRASCQSGGAPALTPYHSGTPLAQLLKHLS